MPWGWRPPWHAFNPPARRAKTSGELCSPDAVHHPLDCWRPSSTPHNLPACVHLRPPDENDPLKADAVIVDETLMVDDAPWMAALMASPARGTSRLVLVGAPDTASPPWAGKPESPPDPQRGVVPTFPSTTTRSSARRPRAPTSEIPHGKLRGAVPTCGENCQRLLLHAAARSQSAVETIVETCARRALPERIRDPRTTQILVLVTPITGGGAPLDPRMQETQGPPGRPQSRRPLRMQKGERRRQATGSLPGGGDPGDAGQ